MTNQETTQAAHLDVARKAAEYADGISPLSAPAIVTAVATRGILHVLLAAAEPITLELSGALVGYPEPGHEFNTETRAPAPKPRSRKPKDNPDDVILDGGE